MNQQNDYQFIKVPINLFYLMDANCSKVLTTLIQMDSFYPKTDGYFGCAYKTLEQACGMSQNLIKASLAGLYLEGIVDIISVGKGRGKHTNKYKINIEKFQDYENTPLGIAIMTEDKPIHQVKYYGTRFKLPWDNEKIVSTTIAQGTAQSIAQGTAQNLTTNIDNISNIDNINNINSLDNNINKENILNNNLYKNNINKETKNSLFEICKLHYNKFNMKNFSEIDFNNYNKNNSFIKENEDLIKTIQNEIFSETGKTENIKNIIHMIEYIKKTA